MPRKENKVSGNELQEEPGHVAATPKEGAALNPPSEIASKTPNGGTLGQHWMAEGPSASKLGSSSRLASQEEVRVMVEAALNAAAPPEVEEDCGRGKRKRTVCTYKEPGMRG